MEFTAGQLAEFIEGELVGNPDEKVNDLAQIEKAQKGAVCFLSDMAYAEYLYTTKASVALVSRDFKPEKKLPETLNLIKVSDPRLAVGQLLNIYHQYKNSDTGIHKSALIEKTSTIGKNAFIGANVYIGNNTSIGDNVRIKAGTYIGNGVQIGNDCSFHANVTIEDDTIIGNHCTFQPGAVIGSEGFGFQPNSENNYQKIYHIGNVVIEDHVEIGANTTIDRGTIGSTLIKKGVKLDNLIQVGHNVEIGNNTVIAAQVGLAGSTIIGKNCMFGGQVGFAGHQKIADGVKMAGQTGVTGDITKENAVMQGSPAFDISDFRKSYIYFRKLPKLVKDISKLEKEIKKLKSE